MVQTHKHIPDPTPHDQTDRYQWTFLTIHQTHQEIETHPLASDVVN